MEETDYKESKGWMNPQKWTDLANMEKIRQYASEIREKADIFVGGNRRDDVTVCAARLLPA